MSKVSNEVFDVVAFEEGQEVFKINSAKSVKVSYERGRAYVEVEDALFNDELFEAIMNGEFYGRYMQVKLKTVLQNGKTQEYDPFELELKDAEIVRVKLDTVCGNSDGNAFPVHITLRAYVAY